MNYPSPNKYNKMNHNIQKHTHNQLIINNLKSNSIVFLEKTAPIQCHKTAQHSIVITSIHLDFCILLISYIVTFTSFKKNVNTMQKNKLSLKEITNQKDLKILNITSAISIKGGDDKRPPRPIGGGGPIFVPNGMTPCNEEYQTY
jgi:hypothetical protein